jgi:hypothetical protein
MLAELLDRIDWLAIPLLIAATILVLWLAAKIAVRIVLAPWIYRDQMQRAAAAHSDRKAAKWQRKVATRVR